MLIQLPVASKYKSAPGTISWRQCSCNATERDTQIKSKKYKQQLKPWWVGLATNLNSQMNYCLPKIAIDMWLWVICLPQKYSTSKLSLKSTCDTCANSSKSHLLNWQAGQLLDPGVNNFDPQPTSICIHLQPTWLFNHKGNLVRSHLHRSPLQGSTSPCRRRTVLHLGMSWWARQWEKFFKHMRRGQGVMFMSPNCLQCLFRNASSYVGIIPCHTHRDTCGIHCDHFEHMAGKISCLHSSCFEVFCTACIIYMPSAS